MHNNTYKCRNIRNIPRVKTLVTLLSSQLILPDSSDFTGYRV